MLNPCIVLERAASARRQAHRELEDAANNSGWDDHAADMHRVYAATYLRWARGHLATLATLPPFPLP